jgi:hypothetical protein
MYHDKGRRKRQASGDAAPPTPPSSLSDSDLQRSAVGIL